ncbi:MAG: DNA repair protein RecN, partial [Deltaproteobacteria bacterium]|nr:DNA repair protein RecN [Deltaproteobacteria bacterium]
ELTLQVEELQNAANQRQAQQDFLEFQCRELTDAKLMPGEDQELETERARLLNAGKLLDAAQNGYERLYEGPQALTGELDKVAGALEALQHLEQRFAPLAETLRNALYSVEDVALQLRDYARHTQNSPERLSEIEERLQRLNRLKRKYEAPNVAALLEKLSRLETEIAQLAQLDETLEETLHLQEETRALLEVKGAVWSEKRHDAAPRLAQRVVAELADLAMPNARFEVRLNPLEKPAPNGLESGEFYFCANAGEELKPLAQIASGGELSRLMLAIYRAAPAQCDTLVFDEVDAGLGGRAGAAVGRKLHDVARAHQVLCVTHLPQVAACADQHWRIEKHEDASGRTVATATHLEGESRDMEMARMLGGPQITATALANARELVAQATSDSLPSFSDDE